MGGFAGSFSGMLAAPLIGYWLDFSHGSYRPLFIGRRSVLAGAGRDSMAYAALGPAEVI